jgi:hypothetical protein
MHPLHLKNFRQFNTWRAHRDAHSMRYFPKHAGEPVHRSRIGFIRSTQNDDWFRRYVGLRHRRRWADNHGHIRRIWNRTPWLVSLLRASSTTPHCRRATARFRCLFPHLLFSRVQVKHQRHGVENLGSAWTRAKTNKSDPRNSRLVIDCSTINCKGLRSSRLRRVCGARPGFQELFLAIN